MIARPLILFWIIFLAALASAAEAPPPRSGRLFLDNGDLFAGELLQGDPKEGLLWKHPAAKWPWSVAWERAAKVEFIPAVSAGESKPQRATVRLVNGDTLAGDVVELADNRLLLETWYAGRLQLPRAAVRRISFNTPGRAVLEGPAAFAGWGGGAIGVQLGTDGEEIGGVMVNSIVAGGPGETAGMKAGDVVTGIDGKNFLKRDALIAAIKSRDPGRKVRVAFRRGEEKLEHEITLAAIGWRVKEGAIRSNGEMGVIGRDVGLPAAANIEFDLDWQGSPTFAFAFCTDNPTGFTMGNAYSLNFSGGLAYLGRHAKVGDDHDTVSLDPPAPLDRLLAGQPAHLSIRFNRQAKTIALLVDDQLVQQWQDVHGFPGKGSGIAFSGGHRSRLCITNLRVSEWDGQLPERSGERAAHAREDSIRLLNQDTFSGEIERIKGAKVSVRASFGAVQIPLERIGCIELATAQAPAVVAASSPLVTGTMPGRGRVTFRLVAWRDGGVELVSPLFGAARFSPVAFTALEFGRE